MASIRLIIAGIVSLFGMILAVPIIFLGLPFWGIASLTRVFSRLFERPYLSWKQLIEFTPTIGWKPKPNLNAFYLTAVEDGIFSVITDSEGWPGKATLGESEVVVFGDSFAFGYGVHTKECFFSQPNGNIRIKAIGAPGYNMVQEILLMSKLSSQLKGKLVVWFIYFGNDLYENLQPNFYRYRMPFVRKVNGTGNWEIVTSHISQNQWPLNPERNYYKRLAEICSPTFLADRVYSACEFLIRKGSDICKQSGAQLVVMTIPDITQISKVRMETLAMHAPIPECFDPGLPDKKIREICDKLAVHTLSFKDYLGVKDHKDYDVHWNERGHKRVAEVLYNLHQDYVLGKMVI
ncbi:MAG TPA: SGNH/GDSL hydrolase family protein [Thermodesulfobacteriota bacterium]